jgi:hypothetical protein
MNSTDDLLHNNKVRQDIYDAVYTLLLARVYLDTISPIYLRVSSQVMYANQPLVANTELNRRIQSNIGEPIKEVDHLYLASNEVATTIYAEIKKGLAFHGVTTDNPDHCAYAVAKTTVSNAEQALIVVMQPHTKISPSMLAASEKRNAFIELTLNCIVPLATKLGQPFKL